MEFTAEAVQRRRRRSRKLVILTTVTTFMMLGAMVVLPMPWRRRPNATAPSASTPLSPARVVTVPHVTLTKEGVVRVDGREVARTGAIDESQRVQKVDGLFDAMRGLRLDDEASATTSKTVDLEIAPDVSAVVVKSVFQTLVFAGYPEIRFVLEDGGRVRVP